VSGKDKGHPKSRPCSLSGRLIRSNVRVSTTERFFACILMADMLEIKNSELLTGHHRSPHAFEEDSRWCCSGLQKHAMSWKRTVHLTSLVHSPPHPTSLGNCSARDDEQAAAFLKLARLAEEVEEPRSIRILLLLLTTWIRVIVEKLIDAHSVKKFFVLVLWKSKVHYRGHNTPSLVPVLTHRNPVRAFLSKPRSSRRFISFRQSHQNSKCVSLFTRACHIPHPFHVL
jgi:hypothetical protein